MPRSLLERKRVVTTIHHIVPEKFGLAERADFAERDSVTTAYHVPCEATREQVAPLTSKPIHVIPFWVNDEHWRPRASQDVDVALRLRLGLPTDRYLVGSFQRDTEGYDLSSPKLEKGPDLLCDALSAIASARDDLHVVLAGWRRQYVIARLQAADIPFTYVERPADHVVRLLYQALDLYLVTARYEGGPQAIVECAAMKVPIVSTPVGLADRILAPRSVGRDVWTLTPDVDHARASVEPLLARGDIDPAQHALGMRPFEEMFQRVMA